MPLTDSDLNSLDELCSAATPGPWGIWSVEEGPDDEVTSVSWGVMGPHEPMPGGGIRTPGIPKGEADASFIATSRTALPSLIEEVRRLRGVVRGLAAKEPLVERQLDRMIWHVCGGCGHTSRQAWTSEYRDADLTVEHAPSCPWRRAREEVAK